MTVAAEATAPHRVLARDSGAAARYLRGVYIIWLRDLIRFWRDRSRLVGSFAQPLLFLFVFGVGLRTAIGGGSFNGVDYITFIYPGVVGMTILFSSIFSGMSVVWDREFGFLKEILVAPVPRSAVALGKTLGGATQAMIQAALMLVLAPIVGVRLSVLLVLELLVLYFFLATALTAMGVAIGARMRSMQGFQVVMNFLVTPMYFLSGAFFALKGLPAWLNALTAIDPVAYGVAPIRHAVLASTSLPAGAVDRIADVSLFGTLVPTWVSLLVVLGFGVAMLGLAMFAFAHRD